MSHSGGRNLEGNLVVVAHGVRFAGGKVEWDDKCEDIYAKILTVWLNIIRHADSDCGQFPFINEGKYYLVKWSRHARLDAASSAAANAVDVMFEAEQVTQKFKFH